MEVPSLPAPDWKVRKLHIWTSGVAGGVVQARLSKLTPLRRRSLPWTNLPSGSSRAKSGSTNQSWTVQAEPLPHRPGSPDLWPSRLTSHG
ncbi:hypothetical protein ACJRO7_031923 [Eucalyptus globulus]|uniref:Uncharacterized protein n=1 Tax=Eucalyptus globulus TaxID=34317 RepID=A0ABD3JIW6_EUCGL